MKFFSFRTLALLIFGVLACRPSHRDLLKRADDYMLDQKEQMAKYLLLQIIQEHPRKDDIRFKALQGLAELSINQLHEYPEAVRFLEIILQEYEGDPSLKSELPALRLKLAKIYRLNLGNSRKGREVLLPLMGSEELDPAYYQEMGRLSLALSDYENARQNLLRVWKEAENKKICGLLRETQMDMIQSFVIQKDCEKARTWMEKQIPSDCRADTFSIMLERAYCYEIMGDAASAIKTYQDLLQKNPNNLRAAFLLDALKRREAEKKIK